MKPSTAVQTPADLKHKVYPFYYDSTTSSPVCFHQAGWRSMNSHVATEITIYKDR